MSKCRIVDGRRVCRNVKNNPFKMWGIWVGTVIGLMFIFIPQLNKIIGNLIDYIRLDLQYNICQEMGCAIYIIILPILGSLIGWGLTILWRKIKR